MTGDGWAEGRGPGWVQGALGVARSGELVEDVPAHAAADPAALGAWAAGPDRPAARLPVWHTALVDPDSAACARSCGATGIPVREASAPDDGMAARFAADGPALLHGRTAADLV